MAELAVNCVSAPEKAAASSGLPPIDAPIHYHPPYPHDRWPRPEAGVDATFGSPYCSEPDRRRTSGTTSSSAVLIIRCRKERLPHALPHVPRAPGHVPDDPPLRGGWW